MVSESCKTVLSEENPEMRERKPKNIVEVKGTGPYEPMAGVVLHFWRVRGGSW